MIENPGKITFIIPCYNEAPVIPAFHSRISAVAQTLPEAEFELLFVNDGSTDTTPDLLNELAAGDPRVKVLHLARNQGHQAAITAGMDFASGDLIVIIDADLQDPPELIHEILNRVGEGCQLIHMQRRARNGETWFKRFTAWLFYKMMKRLTGRSIVENSGDFRAFTRPVLTAVQAFREEHRFMRGIFAFVGFKQCIIQYDRDRRYSGETKYPLARMVRLALNGVLSFSSAPIAMISWLAVFSWVISLGYLVKALVQHYLFRDTVPGWTSIIILLTFFAGLVIFCLAIIGSYVGRIFEQGQQRPLYWVADARNIDRSVLDSSIREVGLSGAIVKSTGSGHGR